MKKGAYFSVINSLLFLFVFDAFSDFTIRSRKIDGISYLHLEDIVKYLGLRAECNEKKIFLSNERYQIVLPVGKRRGYLNSILSQLSFAPKLNRQSYFISEQDFLLLIDPLVRDGSLPDRRVQRIVIDPGHGGDDDGAIGTNNLEKNINLILSKYLKELLVQKGYMVLLTRNDDSFISLTQRGEITRNWKADLFVSIHCNAAPNKSVTGIESYVVTPKGSPSSYKTEIQQNEVPGNAFDTLNARLAYEIQKNLLRITTAADRGLKYYRWQVLREASCPAVLVETGFLSNSGEERKLANSGYQKKLVFGIYNGITEYHQALRN